jgi:hypothetical protein
MVAKMALPLVGGSLEVWGTCWYFFRLSDGGMIALHISNRHIVLNQSATDGK